MKLDSDSSDEKEVILKQHLDALAPKYISTISFVFHFLEQIQRADCSRRHCVWFLGRRHQQPPPQTFGRVTLQARLRKGIENRGFNKSQKFFRPNASNNKWIGFSGRQFWGLGAL